MFKLAISPLPRVARAVGTEYSPSRSKTNSEKLQDRNKVDRFTRCNHQCIMELSSKMVKWFRQTYKPEYKLGTIKSITGFNFNQDNVNAL
ncbi:hypothetical protein PoB_002188200 [Plakobranchus ocellatus]|uniref:Uncharacterized protein n=1 Tax=Plakobranchus ocellatus TaxID=259542 RepID=A0AAV3ZLI6_9GAST|nr:hypothetical protein PoB_002188200 [Plakobranchus ocellatus]